MSKTDKPTWVILRSLPFLGRDQTTPSLPLGLREVFLGIRIGKTSSTPSHDDTSKSVDDLDLVDGVY